MFFSQVSASSEVGDVLDDDGSGPEFVNEPDELPNEARPGFGFKAVLAACNANIGTRETSADDIDGNSVSGQSVGCESYNVFINWNLRPVFLENGAGVRLDFAEGDGFKAACSLKAKAKSAYTAEQIEDAQLAHAALLFASSRCSVI